METTTSLAMILMLILATALYTAHPVFDNYTDQIALFAFKDSIIADPLGALSSWNSSVNLCQWHGVKCGHRHLRVIELDLRSQRLAGSISPFIGNLSFLRSIYLQDNRFGGNIPQEISNLSHLQNLNISSNTLDGEIPSNLSFCLDLRVLNLSDNKLVGKIPAAFGSLSNLKHLFLFGNNLHGNIPPSLGNLSLLEKLFLTDNNLEGEIPESIGHLKNLKSFVISANKFFGEVPPSLYNISTLTELYTAANNLTGSLPSDIGFTLPSLVQIGMGENRFTGRLPASFSNMSSLRVIDFSVNGLFGPVPVDLGRRMNELWSLDLDLNHLGTGAVGDLSFVESLTNCTKLKILDLTDNGFGGVLTNSLTNLSAQLIHLYAGQNQLVGSIPASISKFVNLQVLALDFNFLSGSIPFNIGKLQNLQALYLNGNQLFASIPASIGNLTRLFKVHLEVNNLTGSIPQSLENIEGLQILDISFNNLGGSVPKSIGLFSSLIYMNLSHNSFNGSLPLELGSLANLEQLDISDNDLSGDLPVALGGCLKLEYLLLNRNSFHGSIPSSFAALKGLVHLDLSQNHLSGTIPIGLEKLPFLEKLNLSFNNLQGEMPLKGSFSNKSVISIIGNKNLCGGIPDLHLPTCPVLESKKKNKRLGSKVLIIVISLGLCFIVLLLVVAIHRKRRPRRASSKTSLVEEFVRISYDELFKATEGFSSTNLLGVGSFGSVYKGILHQNEKPIAVKVFDLERLGALKSFIIECEALRKTRHRNLLKIITACSSITFEGNDFKALVFEFMQNHSLESWLHPSEDTTRKLNLVQRLNIAMNVISALEYLHHHCETPIVHCDLKPSNVLLDKDMIAHVGDFGLAKFLPINISHLVSGQTNSIAIKGSIGYIAPEYGMGGLVSAQGDIYSYGILLLEILTGKKPTDEMFKDGLNLHDFCKMALPDNILEIVDPYLIIPEELDDQTNRNRSNAKMRECLSSLVRIGVACSAETPNERTGTSEILMELNAIKQTLFGIGFHVEACKDATSGPWKIPAK